MTLLARNYCIGCARQIHIQRVKVLKVATCIVHSISSYNICKQSSCLKHKHSCSLDHWRDERIKTPSTATCKFVTFCLDFYVFRLYVRGKESIMAGEPSKSNPRDKNLGNNFLQAHTRNVNSTQTKIMRTFFKKIDMAAETKLKSLNWNRPNTIFPQAL